MTCLRFIRQGYGHMYVLPCTHLCCGSDGILLLFFFESRRHHAPPAKPTGPVTRKALSTPNIFHLQYGHSYPLLSALPKIHVVASEEAAWFHLFRTQLSHLPRSVSLRDSIPPSLHLHQHLGHDAGSYNQLSVCPATKDLKVMLLTALAGTMALYQTVFGCVPRHRTDCQFCSVIWEPQCGFGPGNLALLWSVLGRVQEPEHSSSHSKQFACSHPVLPGQEAAQRAQGCFLPAGLHARSFPGIFNLLA